MIQAPMNAVARFASNFIDSLKVQVQKRLAIIGLGLAIVLSITLTPNVSAQGNPILDRLSELPNVTVTEIGNPQFAQGYFILYIPQPLDHSDPSSGKFSQRIFLGVQSLDAPIVMATDGYGVDYAAKPDYQNELSKTLNANLIVVEHRYFGKSQPAKIDYQWLTMAQAAADVHAIKTLLDTILVGKWLTTGTSKGGQAALAHRIGYPEDVSATVVYGTAVKKSPTITTTPLLKPLMESICGMKVAAFQKYCFTHKDSIFPALIAKVSAEGLDFGDMDLQTVLDYALLEFPFSFWQSGGKCESIPADNTSAAAHIDFLSDIVSLKYYTPATRKRWAPAYYMFYRELGYYEYDLASFKQYLSQPQYPNQFFAPKGVEITFDRTYWEAARDFLDAPAAHSVFFIYGQNDPWALQSVVQANKYIVEGGSHKSKFADLNPEQQETLLAKINRCLGQ